MAWNSLSFLLTAYSRKVSARGWVTNFYKVELGCGLNFPKFRNWKKNGLMRIDSFYITNNSITNNPQNIKATKNLRNITYSKVISITKEDRRGIEIIGKIQRWILLKDKDIKIQYMNLVEWKRCDDTDKNCYLIENAP